MNIQLSNHFTYRKLLRFTLPSIIMMIITSIYGVVDGLFVSNLVGSNAFAAVNLIIPFVMIFGTVGFMLGTGGSALVAKTLGEGDTIKANQIFSMLIYFLIAIGVIFSILGIVFLKPIAILLGATPELLGDCVSYGTVLLLALTAFMLQTTFQTFFVVAAKPNMGLTISIASGLTNIVLDFLFILVFRWGVVGAAAATGLSQVVGGIIPFIYFLRKNDSVLKLMRPIWNGKALLISCTNGSSEMITNLSISLVCMIYNFQLMKLVGVNGVAAFGIIMYVSFIFLGVFIGYSFGSAPIISYHFGAENHIELKNIFKKSLVIIEASSLILTLIAEILAMPLAKIFVGYDAELLAITSYALRLFSLSFLFSGVNIFASAFFTALNNGVVSAFISFLRALVFQVIMILWLPVFFGVNGIWLAVVVAELLTLVISIMLFVVKKKQYHYL
ncbi:MATE family efflux transporter [Alkalibaculum sp. M08DMB]|uniref:MATE family efflux transporter n=1 Tax=Alkalibaculum sporogenes TaxID=2655001 RepID=A0A6A7K8N3_9FIRM|nr:MATE family efflux transporter [Alkalibaculum sporogenes]MPW25463.1 MATE family efflux transporter [Alkalibaculum sporogenes]